MHIEFVGRNYEIDDRVRRHAEQKLKKVIKLLDEPIEIQVTLGSENRDQTAEVHVSHRHGTVHAHETTQEMMEAVNQAVDKAEKRLRRAKSKFLDRRRRSGRNGEKLGHWPVAVVDRQMLRSGERRVIKSTNIRIKPMSIEEAALQLEGSSHDFVVFRDAETERVSVLYRRKDSHYGLIAPEF